MCTLRVNNMKTDKTPSAMSYGEERVRSVSGSVSVGGNEGEFFKIPLNLFSLRYT